MNQREFTPEELRRRRARAARRRAEAARREQLRRQQRIVGGLVALAAIGVGGFVVLQKAQSGNGRIGQWAREAKSEVSARVKAGRAGGAVGVATALVTGKSAGAATYAQERADEPLWVYRDGLEEGWQDWSWASHELASSESAATGAKSVKMELDTTKGVYFHHNPFRVDGYGFLEFLYKGNPNQCMATLYNESNQTRKQVGLANFATPAAKSGWLKVRIPIKEFGMKPGDQVAGVVLQARIQSKAGAVFFDEIQLTPDTTLPAPAAEVPVAVSVDLFAERHKISPLIYGVAHAKREELKALGATAHRWGGNANSRHNWVLNAWNSASDWDFRNQGGEGPPKLIPGQSADEFVADTRANGAISYLTVPTLGWVAKDRELNTKSENVPWNTGPGLSGCDGPVAGYDPSANRLKTSVRSVARKRASFDANPTRTDQVYQDEWIAHLVSRFGPANDGGVRYYAMDNEPDLWSFTHRDVHPAQMGYDDIVKNFTDYATAVKDVDPSALVAGPNLSGWTSYFYSAMDRGNDNFGSAPDRRAHGNKPFLPYFLETVRKFDEKNKRRTLDVLDIHYYPQAAGVYSDAKDPATRAVRLRSVRSLWDPTYVDESWIGGTADGPAVKLIPRMKQWIAESYPGTKLSIGEWNFGGDDDMSGGLATVEALGVFGREGVDLAFYWTRPKLETPTASAFQLMRRPAPGVVGFGDESVRALSDTPDKVTTFAAVDSKTGALTLILLNKQPKTAAIAAVKVGGASVSGASQLWRFSTATNGKLVSSAGPAFQNGSAKIALPPYSATLIRVGGAAKP